MGIVLRKIEADLPSYVIDLIFDPAKIEEGLDKKPFNIGQVEFIVEKAIGILKMQPNFIKLGNNFKDTVIIGDIHGDPGSLEKIMSPFLNQHVDSMIFLGDYVDRGKNSLMNYLRILSILVAWPERIIVLRGNHEDLDINKIYGFSTEIHDAYPVEKESSRLLQLIGLSYNYLSLACCTPQRSIAFHGGIPRDIIHLEELNSIPKPHLELALNQDRMVRELHHDLLYQIRWNDPKEDQEAKFQSSVRGAGIFTFNEEVVDEFLSTNNGKRIIRAHESVRGGFQELFGGKLLHVFSTEPYFGRIFGANVIRETKEGKTYLCDLDVKVIKEI